MDVCVRACVLPPRSARAVSSPPPSLPPSLSLFLYVSLSLSLWEKPEQEESSRRGEEEVSFFFFFFFFRYSGGGGRIFRKINQKIHAPNPPVRSGRGRKKKKKKHTDVPPKAQRIPPSGPY